MFISFVSPFDRMWVGVFHLGVSGNQGPFLGPSKSSFSSKIGSPNVFLMIGISNLFPALSCSPDCGCQRESQNAKDMWQLNSFLKLFMLLLLTSWLHVGHVCIYIYIHMALSHLISCQGVSRDSPPPRIVHKWYFQWGLGIYDLFLRGGIHANQQMYCPGTARTKSCHHKQPVTCYRYLLCRVLESKARLCSHNFTLISFVNRNTRTTPLRATQLMCQNRTLKVNGAEVAPHDPTRGPTEAPPYHH